MLICGENLMWYKFISCCRRSTSLEHALSLNNLLHPVKIHLSYLLVEKIEWHLENILQSSFLHRILCLLQLLLWNQTLENIFLANSSTYLPITSMSCPALFTSPSIRSICWKLGFKASKWAEMAGRVRVRTAVLETKMGNNTSRNTEKLTCWTQSFQPSQ